MRLLILVAAAAFSVPATAHEAMASYPTGARVEALVGYEGAALDFDIDDEDEVYSFSESKDMIYGAGIGYDFAAGGRSSASKPNIWNRVEAPASSTMMRSR